ncbi:ribonuclease inhibitor-like [Brachyhypopomus gauderio]|uniref:ribonuclease inhibitor-like n=1 Tax=Brachyhypopomus gauderio TaxID=698409 RepID=UPI0040433D62
MECVWVVILFLHWSLSGAQYFDLEGEDVVVAAAGSDVTLPCSLTPRMSAVDMEVKWTRQDLGDTLVHHYKNKQDQTDQDPSYMNRTSLFIEKLQQGNTSLLLKKVQVSDGGQYRCRVDSEHKQDQINVLLKIEAVVGGTPEITVLGTGVSGGVLLQCESRGWWPVPDLQWLNSEGAELSAESCGDLKGFNVRLQLTAHKSNNNVYICRLKQGQIMMEKQIDITDHLPKPDYTAAITVPITLILLSALVCVVVYYRRRADMCLKREGERRLHGVNFTDAHLEHVEHVLLISEENLDEFDLKKYDPSEESFLKMKNVVYACRKAQLSYCNLTEKSCDVLASVLTSNSSLRELDLSGNILRNSGVKILCSGLESKDCKLEKLSLSYCMITEVGCAALCSALRSNPSSHLRELNLHYNKSVDSGVKQLSDLLEDSNCKLEKLDLSDCSIREEDCAALCSALKKNPSSHLRDLNLNSNKPGDSGVKQLSALMEDPHCKLEKLDLSDCSIREEGCAALCSALKKNPSSHLRELNLNYNEPGDSGVKQLSALLKYPHCTLEILDLSDCGITEKGCAALCSALKKNPSSHLRELNLNSNKPGDSGVKLLSDLLENPHCTLEKLNLSDCRITEKGCAALCSALQKNLSSHLKELNLNHNKPGDSGVEQLSALLEDPHCTLEKLDLSWCSIREEGCVALCSALKKNPSSHLRELNLDYNKSGLKTKLVL